jgi:hypothetical protein
MRRRHGRLRLSHTDSALEVPARSRRDERVFEQFFRRGTLGMVNLECLVEEIGRFGGDVIGSRRSCGCSDLIGLSAPTR